MEERELLEGAYRKYWDRVEMRSVSLGAYYPYELCKEIESVNWQLFFIGQQLAGELMESINWLNRWRTELANLMIWPEVLAEYEEDDAWYIKMHFVDPLAHGCMLQPSATRDRLGKVASNAIHQARLILEKGYRDVLDEDKQKGRPLLRSGVEKQLVRLAEPFAEAIAFIETLRKLDANAYREKTNDYRNLASHFLPPKFDKGHVFSISRSRTAWTEFVQQADGTHKEEVVPGKMGTSYAWGYMEPLALRDLIDLNIAEYQHARDAFDEYSSLLRLLLDKIWAIKTLAIQESAT